MATVAITDKAAKAAKAKAGQRIEIWDRDTTGLCLRVSGIEQKGREPRQRKVWVYRYRTLDGRQPRLTLGAFSAEETERTTAGAAGW